MYEVGGSKDSPTVILNEGNNTFRIEGPSFAENAIPVYSPILEWVDTHMHAIKGELKCEFDFFYLNSSSKRSAYNVLKKLEEHYLKGKKISIIWHFDQFDDDMLEQGQEFSDVLNLPFVFSPKKG